MDGTTSTSPTTAPQNFLFHNKHNGTFKEIANETGSAYGQNGEATSSMGPVAADFWDAGVLDLWVTDGNYNRFLKNLGAPTRISSPTTIGRALTMSPHQPAYRKLRRNM